MRTLIDISDDVLALHDLLEETGGELTDDQAEEAVNKWLAELGAERDRKVDGYCAIIREMELIAAARREESERLLKRAEARESRSRWLKLKLLNALVAMGVSKVDGPENRFCVTICKNGGKIPLILSSNDPLVIPTEYRTEKVVYSIDSEKIRSEIEYGKDLPFAKLGERGVHLRIT